MKARGITFCREKADAQRWEDEILRDSNLTLLRNTRRRDTRRSSILPPAVGTNDIGAMKRVVSDGFSLTVGNPPAETVSRAFYLRRGLPRSAFSAR